jgi:hypothetical protein
MYPRIPWKQVADPLGSAEYTLGTTALEYIILQIFSAYNIYINATCIIIIIIIIIIVYHLHTGYLQLAYIPGKYHVSSV